MAGIESPALRPQITLIGDWLEFDPQDPLPGPDYSEIRELLRNRGFPLALPTAAGRPLLGAVLWEWAMAEYPDAPPLAAVVILTEHEAERRLDVQLIDGRGIVPRRVVSRRRVEWPTPDVDVVEFLQVSYLVPAPGGDCYYTALFETPNLTIAADMEFLFDSIMATMVWVDEEAEQAV